MSKHVVWKYEVALCDEPTVIEPPTFAKPLHIGEQNGRVMTWWRGDPEEPAAGRILYVVGTGQVRIAQYDEYIGTVQMQDGFVWHVFERVLLLRMTIGDGQTKR